MKHIFSAGIIVFRMNDNTIEYLLLKYAAGHWDFPKGKIEESETKKIAALRELHEEAGITATILPDFQETFSYIFDHYDNQKAQKTVYFFVGQACSSSITLSHEHSDYQWLPYTQALTTLTYVNAQHTLKKAHEFLLNAAI